MNCKINEKLLSMYLDGVLAITEKKKLEKHLKICHKCSQELNLIRRTKEILSNVKMVELPANYEKEIQEKYKLFKNNREYIYESFGVQQILSFIYYKAIFFLNRHILLHPIRYACSILSILILLSGLMYYLMLFERPNKVQVNQLLLAHHNHIKSTDLTNRDMSYYISSNINCNTNNIVLTGE